MNKQLKLNPDGTIKSRGIEWCQFSWNAVKGCKHECRWTMPDGTTAICYAEAVANGVAQSAYKQGFAHHYWEPKILEEPLKVKEPSKIFLDSMSDLMGHWVPDEQIQQVLDVCERAHWHSFQLLTKNAPRLLNFKFPKNVWVGASVPPSQMFGNVLTEKQQVAMLRKTLDVLDQVDAPIRWMSLEPFSWDMAWLLRGHHLQWAVIGAATNGAKAYQPDTMWVIDAIEALDQMDAKVFFKGNLVWDDYGGYEWREEFPEVKAVAQMEMFK